MKIRRGDVYWMQLEGRRRPAVVLTRDSAIPLLKQLIVAPATRTIRGIPSEVQLTRNDGMPEECALSADNLQIVHKSLLKSRITTLSPTRMEELCEALHFSLGC
ncbi:MAG: type II toxin-antitoxin system PemK/MazF family toxin [Actinomycetota bacterium]